MPMPPPAVRKNSRRSCVGLGNDIFAGVMIATWWEVSLLVGQLIVHRGKVAITLRCDECPTGKLSNSINIDRTETLENPNSSPKSLASRRRLGRTVILAERDSYFLAKLLRRLAVCWP